MGATAVLVAETPAAEAPVTVTPVAEAPVAETPAVETPAAHSDTPAPMETGRVGDDQSWVKCIKAGIDEEFQQDRPTKHRQAPIQEAQAKADAFLPPPRQ